MTVAATSLIVEQVAALERALAEAPAGERREKALYHADRLKLAIQASHQEAVRFAAFTLDKTVRDAGDAWPTAIAGAMGALRAALHDAGHHY